MKADDLKHVIRRSALAFAKRRGLAVDESHSSAVMFTNVADSFHPESYGNILKHPEWIDRTKKTHPNVRGAKEMQSSNSSDALLMNIFCHPFIGKWGGVRKLLEADLDSIAFGFPAAVQLKSREADRTEIDLAFSDTFCEAKLTESDFTQKRTSVVENYVWLHEIFHSEALPLRGNDYDNYQLIRNLLASAQHGRKHMLLCDERRADLVRRYMTTVSCLRDAGLRMKCRVIFWQEILAECGESLRHWVEEKYGMGQPSPTPSDQA
jgi:hypothetical protein